MSSPELSYTVRPWVRTGLPMYFPQPVSVPTTPSLSDPLQDKGLATIRIVDAIPGHNATTSTPPTSYTPDSLDTPTPPSPLLPPTSRTSSKQDRTPRSNLFGARDRNTKSPQTPSSTGRKRGKTIPASSSPHTPEARPQSALSWTPSTSSTQVANWISGLLRR